MLCSNECFPACGIEFKLLRKVGVISLIFQKGKLRLRLAQGLVSRKPCCEDLNLATGPDTRLPPSLVQPRHAAASRGMWLLSNSWRGFTAQISCLLPLLFPCHHPYTCITVQDFKSCATVPASSTGLTIESLSRAPWSSIHLPCQIF